jgi:UDP-N-acetylmuramoyl-L-alanyl-D-glutamate--2,6-diaminopimelate ligase
MKLGTLLKDCDGNLVSGIQESIGEKDITGIEYDSRRLKEGDLFVALRGAHFDGHHFIGDAVKAGAAIIVCESSAGRDSGIHTEVTEKGPLSRDGTARVSFLQVDNSRKTLACIAHNFYGRPSENLVLVGVTGTNGKTTTTYILKAILDAWGKDVGLIGTIQYMVKDMVVPALFTTPEALEFQRLLRDMLTSGCTYVVSEVSSHALSQYRVDGAVFRTAIFTNLTRDHLDYHKTMEEYFGAKRRLFRDLLWENGTAIINIDDPYGKILMSEMKDLKSSMKGILTYGVETTADITASSIESSFSGLRFTLSFQDASYHVSSPLTGIHNVYNILSAAGAAVSLGVPWEIILRGISQRECIRGRFEKVQLGQGFLCVVDYAHTEDALERLIRSARDLITVSSSAGKETNTRARIFTVFGCGGDRDRGKRPLMGEVATRLSDCVVFTSDNPRSEEPLSIIRDIEKGAVANNYFIEPDRTYAIKRAVEMAEEGDIVLIAGKGHEDYQEIKGIRTRMNDRDITEKAIKDKMKRMDQDA